MSSCTQSAMSKAADLYNVRTGETKEYVNATMAKKAAARARAVDATMTDWILMDGDGRLYHTRLHLKWAGGARETTVMCWLTFSKSAIKQVLAEYRAGGAAV